MSCTAAIGATPKSAGSRTERLIASAAATSRAARSGTYDEARRDTLAQKKKKPASRRLSKGTIEEESDSVHRHATALCAIQRARRRS
ncbi:hypothetical protein X946_3666 [Burkholderia sp. ABCPW 111]|nr:hypothetical protein X946_3666 [Burkholderia sp. ABCPW 111]